jgi:hypothetical protein
MTKIFNAALVLRCIPYLYYSNLKGTLYRTGTIWCFTVLYKVARGVLLPLGMLKTYIFATSGFRLPTSGIRGFHFRKWTTSVVKIMSAQDIFMYSFLMRF